MLLACYIEAQWLIHLNLFIQHSIEKHSLYIHLK